jgi:hypothetical protein
LARVTIVRERALGDDEERVDLAGLVDVERDDICLSRAAYATALGSDTLPAPGPGEIVVQKRHVTLLLDWPSV